MATSKIPNVIDRQRGRGATYSILSYDSSSNAFIAPHDGYIIVQVWNFDTSSLSLWYEGTLLEVRMTKQARQSFMVFVVKGSKWHCTGSGNDRSAVFVPTV